LPTETRLPDLQGIKVLVVEDNRINQQVARELLESAGAEVQVAGNGALAVQAVRTTTFDLILMDVQMPDMDGCQATRMIRKGLAGQALPIIAMTAHAMVGDREKCLAAGMDDYLSKPIDPSLLYAMLRKWTATIVEPGTLVGADQEPVPEVNLPTRLPGIDIAHGLLRIGGNRTLLRMLLLDFIADHHNDMNLLTTALAKQDLTQARRLVHTLRSVAGTIGAEQLETRAETLEQDLAGNQAPDAALSPFIEEFHRVMNGLTAALIANDTDTPAAPAKTSAAPGWEADLRELNALMIEGDTNSKGCLDRCLPQLRQHATEAEIRLLKEQVAAYDFKDALTTLQRIFGNEH